MLIVCAAPASSVTFWRSAFLNPWSSADTSYLPPGRFGMVNNPDESVTVVRVSCVSRFVTDTVTPGTTPALGIFDGARNLASVELRCGRQCRQQHAAECGCAVTEGTLSSMNLLLIQFNIVLMTFSDFQDDRVGEATPGRDGSQVSVDCSDQ